MGDNLYLKGEGGQVKLKRVTDTTLGGTINDTDVHIYVYIYTSEPCIKTVHYVAFKCYFSPYFSAVEYISFVGSQLKIP